MSIFVQNALLYAFGVAFNLAFVAQAAPELISEGRFFEGHSWRTVAILCTMVGQGMVVSAVVKLMSNVAKACAGSSSHVAVRLSTVRTWLELCSITVPIRCPVSDCSGMPVQPNHASPARRYSPQQQACS